MDQFLGLVACLFLLGGLGIALKKHQIAFLVIGLGFLIFALRTWLADDGQLWLMLLLAASAFGQFIRGRKARAA